MATKLEPQQNAKETKDSTSWRIKYQGVHEEIMKQKQQWRNILKHTYLARSQYYLCSKVIGTSSK